MEKGKIIGNLSIREFFIFNQEEPYAANEYLIAESNGTIIPLEVIESMAVSMLLPETVPGLNSRFLDKLNVDEERPIFLAKVKVLVPLAIPLFPNSIIRTPSFNEVEDRLIYANPNDALKLGVIKGTERMQKDLPAELSRLAPLWKDKKAVEQNGVPFILDYHKFREYPHVGIFGTSGSGKTFGLRVVVEELMEKNIPGLVLDPHHEMEYKQATDGLPDEMKQDFKDKYDIFYVGKNMGIPFEELKLDELIYLIEFVGALSEPMKSALEAVYEPGDTLIFLKQKVQKLKEAFEYMEKPAHMQKNETLDTDAATLYEKHRNQVSGSTTLQALSWRLESLEGTDVFSFSGGIQGIERSIQSGKMAVLRGDMRRLQMVAFYTIRKLYKKRRNYQDFESNKAFAIDPEKAPDYFPMFFVVVDEAHNFAPNGGNNPTKRILKTIAQEARKYGIFEIFCTQKPDGLDPTIFAQLNTKIIYRINTATDMELVRQETNLNAEQMAQLPELQSGHCFVSSAILPKTFSVQFRTTYTKSPHTVDPFEELKTKMDAEDLELTKLLTQFCRKGMRVTDIPRKHLPLLSNELNRSITFEEIQDALASLERKNLITKIQSPFGITYQAS